MLTGWQGEAKMYLLPVLYESSHPGPAATIPARAAAARSIKSVVYTRLTKSVSAETFFNSDCGYTAVFHVAIRNAEIYVSHLL